MKSNLRWQFHHDQPSKDLYDKWKNICDNDPNSCAASYPDFATASKLLLSYSSVIYAYCFLEDEMICAIPLFVKSKRLCFIECNILQVVNHDHLDVYVLPIKDSFRAEDVINSFMSAIQIYINDWDYFQARNLLCEHSNSKSLSNIIKGYKKQSAYFKIENCELLSDVISSKLIKNINRLQKKLTNNNESLKLKCLSLGQGVDALDEFIKLENSGWKGRSKTSIGSRDDTYKFYSKIWGADSKIPNTQVYLLYLNDEPIAGGLSFRNIEKIYLHKIAYLDSLNEYGPGSILIKFIIEESLSDSSLNMVCLNTYPDWAKRWHPDVFELLAIECFNSNIKGMMLKLFFSSYRLARNLKAWLVGFL